MPSGTTSYTYDAYGRLETVTDPDGVSVTRYTYDTHGNKESVIYPNGIITEYGYDTLNRLISVETRSLMSDIIASYAYTLNAKGQRTHVEERVGTQLVRTIDYTYDAADRLTEEQIDDVITGVRTVSYTYDPVGNRLEKNDNGVITSYTYDDNDRLLTEGGFSYGYDNNGNMLSKTGNGEQYNFTYNALNQLVHANINTGGGSSTVDYVYDHDGIRVGKTINGMDVTKYIVDKNRPYAQVLEEQWSNGALSATTGYVYGDVLLSRTSNGPPLYYLYDGMGSVRGLTDSAGSLTDAYTYDAYGNLLDKTGSTINSYLYRGEQYDDDLSSYYLRARYYQPGIGRFLTTDPEEGFITNPMTQHRYVYGNCDPGNSIDPSGRMNLTEKMVTVTILGNVAAIGWGSLFEHYFGVYSWLAEKVFPDAYIIGINWNIVSVDLIYLLNIFNKFGPGSFPPGQISLNYFWGKGYEMLISVSSAEWAIFKTGFKGREFGHGLSPISMGFELYDGSVFNLWNANDYEGPFEAYTIGLGSWGKTIFWDAERVFNGPWGTARTILSKSFSWRGANTKKVSGAYSAIDYKYKTNEPETFDSQGEAVLIILDTVFVANILKNKFRDFSASVLLDATIWLQTGVAKYYWSKREPKYNVQARQDPSRKRPDEFRSGPSYSFLGGWF